MEYPGNSYAMRGEMKRVASEDPSTYQNTSGHYYVRLKYTVWPELYGDELPIPFPTLKAALFFAEINITSTVVRARVYTPSGTLVTIFAYSNSGTVRNDLLS